MKRLLLTFILVLTLFTCLLPSIIAEDNTQNTETEHFIYLIDGQRLVSVSPDIVISSKNIILVHNYNIININYTSENGTVLKDGISRQNVLQLSVYENSHIILTDSENNVILDMFLHSMSIGNFFKYVLPLQYQQLVLTVVFSFIGSILLILAFYINKETKVI